MLSQLLTEADAAGELDWAVSVDSTVVRAHQHGATARRTDPEDTSTLSAQTKGSSVAWR